MGDRGVGKPWTSYEDGLLVQAVAMHGEVDNWKTVALSVPGRTNKACRKRWLHSLSPSVKKTAWTAEEDQLLLSLYAVHSTKWSVIARHIPGRTDDACSKRYREALDPSLKRDEWTSQEDALLLEVYSRLGGKWGQVGQELRRSGLACRNRWRMIERKKAALLREDASRNAVPQNPQQFSEAYPSHMTTQWSTVPVQPGAFWDGNVAHYVVPSSSLHQLQQESVFAPTQPSAPLEPPTFQFASSSLSSALASPEISRDTGSKTPFSSELPSVDQTGVGDTSFNVPQTTENSYEEHDIAVMDDMIDFEFHADTATEATAELPQDPPISAARDGSEPEGLNPEHNVPSCTKAHTPCPSSSSTNEDGISSCPSPAPAPCVDTLGASDPLRHYRPSGRKTAKLTSSRKIISRSRSPPRLSSNLPATADSSVLAYACGHPQCWPSDANTSCSCFATSKDLLEHMRTDHPDESASNGPFRCALQGCGKTWKSINGLQYHLQISKVHFQQALLTSRTVDQPHGDTANSDGLSKNKKLHVCPNCQKQYKQLSGLRYHLSHGHPVDLPAQLDVIPPMLARKVAERTQSRTVGSD